MGRQRCKVISICTFGFYTDETGKYGEQGEGAQKRKRLPLTQHMLLTIKHINRSNSPIPPSICWCKIANMTRSGGQSVVSGKTTLQSLQNTATHHSEEHDIFTLWKGRHRYVNIFPTICSFCQKQSSNRKDTKMILHPESYPTPSTAQLALFQFDFPTRTMQVCPPFNPAF